MLRRENINVNKVSEKGKEFSMPTFGTGVSSKELAIFTRQFSVMIDAGLPLVQCLEILAGQQENKIFQKMLTGVRASVEGGTTLSAAMKQFDKVFDPLYYNMVEAGETGGILDTILQRLSAYIEKNVKLQRAVKSALIYPVAVIGIAAAVIVLLLWKVVPIFVTLFDGLGAELPLPTRIVIGLSNFVGSIYGLFIVVGFVGAAVALKFWYGTPAGSNGHRRDHSEASADRHFDEKNCRGAVHSYFGNAHLERRTHSRRLGHYRQNVGERNRREGHYADAEGRRSRSLARRSPQGNRGISWAWSLR